MLIYIDEVDVTLSAMNSNVYQPTRNMFNPGYVMLRAQSFGNETEKSRMSIPTSTMYGVIPFLDPFRCEAPVRFLHCHQIQLLEI